MTDSRHPSSRRRFLAGSAAALGAALLSGCDSLGKTPWFRRILDKDEDANLFVQRLLLSNQKLAPEYTAADLSPWFKPNGTSDPTDMAYKAMAKGGFKSFRLAVGGLVEHPAQFSLGDLRAMPSRTQITRHDCVEGWSCIGGWTGVPLSELLARVGLKPEARFVVFYCADTMEEAGGLDSFDDDAGEADQSDGGTKAKTTLDDKAAEQSSGKAKAKEPAVKATTDPGKRYYESIDLEDAYHPQTILAYAMNGEPLPVAHGAPLRLRVERQLGYKMAKYVMRIELVDRLESIGKGGGGYWEDNGYEWYAGI